MSEIEKRKAEALEGAIVQDGSRGALEVRIAEELLERGAGQERGCVAGGPWRSLAGMTGQVT